MRERVVYYGRGFQSASLCLHTTSSCVIDVGTVRHAGHEIAK